MSSEPAEPGAAIKAGDRVRALDGAYKGRVGTVLRVVTSRDEGRTSRSILVSFPAGGADYLDAGELEKTEAAAE
ncbi:MAG TPA: KOW motif domain-containing protein [Pyrinomonadaceae bacterium]|nr:KOW motif domain-containing protein [Pyrinomonadaceae bacterium]